MACRCRPAGRPGDRNPDPALLPGRSLASGELRPGVDPELLIDQLAGTLHYRMLLGGGGPTDTYTERLVDAVLDGALTPSADV